MVGNAQIAGIHWGADGDRLLCRVGDYIPVSPLRDISAHIGAGGDPCAIDGSSARGISRILAAKEFGRWRNRRVHLGRQLPDDASGGVGERREVGASSDFCEDELGATVLVGV